MTNQVTPYTKKFMLLTYSKLKYIITEQQEKALRNTPDKSDVIINGNKINSSNISDIIELGEYYRQRPEEKPAVELPTFKSEAPIPFSLAKNRRALQSMIKGLSDCVERQGYPISLKQQVIMDGFVTRLKALDGLTEATYQAKPFNTGNFLDN